MVVKLNEEEMRLYGTCDKCGSALYEIDIDSGWASCSGCEINERFDPKQFTNDLYEH